MNQEFIHLMNAVLLSRLVYVFKDTPIPKRSLVLMLVVQMLGLLWYEISWTCAGLGLLMVGQGVIFQPLETRGKRPEGYRMISLLITIVAGSVFFSPWIHLGFNQGPFETLKGLRYYSLLLNLLDNGWWVRFGGVLMGGLLVLNEVNLPVRSLLTRLRFAPQPGEADPVGEHALNEKEFNTGRVVGMLERVIIYIAVLSNQITAIGLVLAAKGFTRFKELENRRFAEYVLIGTLLSAFLAVAVAIAVKGLLGPS
jgi:hypothetical protein